MADDGAKKGGYKFDYAATARAICKGPKPCHGTKLEKGTLRVGSVVDFRGHTSWSFRHYGCTTKKVFQNMKAAFGSVEEVEGFDSLTDADKVKVREAWEKEEVAPEDVPPTAVAGAEDEDETKKRPSRPRKKKVDEDFDDDDDEPKPKKKAVRRKKKADSDDDADISPSEDDAGSDYGGSKKRKRAGGSKRTPKKRRTDDDD